MFEKLELIEKRYEEINQLMAQPEVATNPERLQKLAQEQSGIAGLVGDYREFKATEQSLKETTSLLDEGLDNDMASMIREELDSLNTRRESLWQQIELALLPKDPNDDRNVIVEIRAGAGGNEAGLFAADLYRMYTRYSESKGWTTEVLSSNESGIGGFKEIIFGVHGKGAYSRLKHESGVHRVQRVPATESSGRIHTSTATVAVLPEADEVEVRVDPDDLKIDVFHAGGAGGQNVNKVATAIRMTHLPTGMVVVCQDERSQLRNKTKALAVLRARLLDAEQRRQQEAEVSTRRSQVGSGDRSEKIRTYNFPQDRITDHRIGQTVHNLPAFLGGELDGLIDAVATSEQARLLQESLT